MQCSDLIKHIDDWCDGTLTPVDRDACAAHLEGCSACRRRVQAEEQRFRALADLPVPEPDGDFENRMLQAAHGGQRQMRWSSPMVGGAMAACLVVGLMLGQMLPMGSSDTGTPVAEVPVGPVMSDEIRTVGLSFSSGEALDNVTLTLELPPHIELASFPGERSLSWQVDLDKGQNMLALPVRMLFPGQGELVAHLDDGNRRKTLRTSVDNIWQDNGKET